MGWSAQVSRTQPCAGSSQNASSRSAPGYEMYYLNVMAGPGADRELAFCDDPAHGWVRDTWADLATDPRCPMTSAAGRREPS